MRKILFLDIDGVLHGGHDAQLARLELMEAYLSKMPDVEIVISSSWREDHALDQLRNRLGAALRERISAVTPSLACGYEPGGRQREIEAFLDGAVPNEAKARWIALDDMAYLFDDGCPGLILVNPATGFTDREGLALLDWYRKSDAQPLDSGFHSGAQPD